MQKDLQKQTNEYIGELAKTTNQLLRRFEQYREEFDLKLSTITKVYEIAKIQSQIEAKQAKEELETLRAKDEMIATRIRVLILKHRSELDQKVEETPAHEWKEWSVQGTKNLQYFRADTKNQKKEGRGFYKMDETTTKSSRKTSPTNSKP